MAIRNKEPKQVIISPQAKDDINNILLYLTLNWNQKIVDRFLEKLEAFYFIISINPRIFGYYDKRKNIRKYALTKQNIIYDPNRKSIIEIITVFNARQDPMKLKDKLK